MFWFEEGLFVTAADPEYKRLLGARHGRRMVIFSGSFEAADSDSTDARSRAISAAFV
jgi:hypothetical protein